MRIFVTGATGYIGSAVVRELLGAGHQVIGLARSDSAAAALSAVGADVRRGELEDLDSLRAGATAADGVIYAANQHITETTDPAARARVELSAVEAIGAALEGSDKPFVVTSGTLGLTFGRLGTEADAPDVERLGAWALRVPTEHAVIAMGERSVRAAALRLAPLVHGEGDLKGFTPTLIGIARAKGVSAYVGDGSNRWPAVHRLDAAHLYRLAVEAAPAGSRLHAVDDEGVRLRDIAEAIGRQLKVPVVSLAAEDAGNHFGFLGPLVSIDSPTSSALTQERLGWRPTRPALIADIKEGHYFND
ncbi:SDR family oxidoreductase [Kutzneria sp. 744]|uniref:SDR family oxidoreductase n=1 Tax=Kutzneria sp. (strain 744) TaxID=345341 RepID=UPI0003EEDE43|nr:SDR family oxidoreductase [Kutzneria sp. 744]EWM10027.1 NAD dependent epimerase/dehydratase [Kutzneria sp. 744]